MYLLPVIDFAILALGIVKGEDRQFIAKLPSEHLCDKKAIGEIHAGISDSVCEVKSVEPLEDFSGESGAATDGAEHMLYYYDS